MTPLPECRATAPPSVAGSPGSVSPSRLAPPLSRAARRRHARPRSSSAGLVTSTGSGLAVPDWPLSYGMLMPPMVGGIFYEHGHRMAASVRRLPHPRPGALDRARGEPRPACAGWPGPPWPRSSRRALLGGLTVIFLLPTADLRHPRLPGPGVLLPHDRARLRDLAASGSGAGAAADDVAGVRARGRRRPPRPSSSSSSSARSCGTPAPASPSPTSRSRSAAAASRRSTTRRWPSTSPTALGALAVVAGRRPSPGSARQPSRRRRASSRPAAARAGPGRWCRSRLGAATVLTGKAVSPPPPTWPRARRPRARAGSSTLRARRHLRAAAPAPPRVPPSATPALS